MSLAELLKPDAEDLAEHYPSRAERFADGWVHGVGFFVAAIGIGVLVSLRLGESRRAAWRPRARSTPCA